MENANLETQGTLTFIARVRQFVVGAAVHSRPGTGDYTTRYLVRSAWSNNAPSKAALLAMGAAAYVISFCITLLLLA
jgi:hypothetical protein